MILNTGRAIRRLSNILVFVISAMTAFSCVKEEPFGGGTDGDEAVVRLTIKTPGVTSPRTPATRNLIDEYGIENIKVVLLEKRGGDGYRYRYMADGQNIQSGENNRTTFHALLKGSTVPVKLLLVANYGDAFDNYVPLAGDSEEDIRAGITASFKPGSHFIPMYGEVSLDKLSTETSNTISVTMLRAWARVDISTNLDTQLSKNFQMAEAYIYRGRQKLQITPDGSALSEAATPRVISPSVPNGVGTLDRYGITTSDPAKAEGLYLAECDPVYEESQKLKGASCIVVGGYFEDDEKPSYYRIDFDSGAEGHPYGQVLRNYKYSFVITKVTGRGWETPDEAANNRATTIVTEVKMWQDYTTYMIANGDNYLGISDRELYLPYKKDSENVLHVQASVPYSVCFEDSPATTITVGGSGTIENQYFRVRIVNYPGDEDDMSHIEVTSLQDNMTQENFESKLIIKYSNWTLKVTLIQYHFKEFVSRSIRVLSVHAGSSGHLGSMSGYGDGSAMRKILSNANNFSTSGTVNFFSGFDFSVVPNIDYFRYADGTNSYTHQARSWLFAADVLYLANDNYISEYSARMILEWLHASPSRVLIMGADGDQTSPTLIREDKDGFFSKHVDWWYNQSAATSYKREYINESGGFYSCAENTDNREFFSGGPFPTTSVINFKIADNYFGYAKSYINDITPLMTHSNLSGSMIVGVDKDRRVVYHGDASMWQPAQMSTPAANSGTISTDVDRFWANLWSWVAYQVIWGGDVY